MQLLLSYQKHFQIMAVKLGVKLHNIY